DFERFDPSKIGTGEGAQAYGHGLYFAGNEGVAQSYRDVLTPKLKIDNQPVQPTTTAQNLVVAHGGDVDAAIKEFSGRVEGWMPGTRDRIKATDTLAEMESLRGRVSFGPGGGKMYEVNIAADPEHFLHWDKPLSEQSPYVRNAIEKAGLKPTEPDLGSFGGVPVRGAPRWADTPEAAQALRDAGIPGIRYLDQGSRGAGQGTSNYVVFDAATIDILRKYGLAGLMAGGGAAAAGSQQQSQ
ncbi:MAG TPA: hypothetical protein VGH84_08760, partial [Steroidobacteraceae bacterium]